MVSLPARKNFKKIKEKEKFVIIINEFGDSKSTIVKLIIKHPKKTFIIFALFKKKLRKVYKENFSNFKH